jgi:hypothetical protein
VLVQAEAGEPEAHSFFVLGANGGGWLAISCFSTPALGYLLLLVVEREGGVLIRGAEVLAAW